VNNKKRFEVFKRDKFTCQYCGKQAPLVELEVDHIVPISKGGGDEMFNLATSCFTCNRGKRAQILNNDDVKKHPVLSECLSNEKNPQAFELWKMKLIVERFNKAEGFQREFMRLELDESFKNRGYGSFDGFVRFCELYIESHEKNNVTQGD
jgi:CRISPR/Cas system Type II protein with McrA/HNH and RuvC-like nuclease domain